MIGKHILVGTIITVELFGASAYGVYKYAEHNNKELYARQQIKNTVSDVKSVENKPVETKVSEFKPKEVVKEKSENTAVKYNNDEERVAKEKSETKNVKPKPVKSERRYNNGITETEMNRYKEKSAQLEAEYHKLEKDLENYDDESKEYRSIVNQMNYLLEKQKEILNKTNYFKG